MPDIREKVKDIGGGERDLPLRNDDSSQEKRNRCGKPIPGSLERQMTKAQKTNGWR